MSAASSLVSRSPCSSALWIFSLIVMRSRISFRTLFMLTSPNVVHNRHEHGNMNNHRGDGVKRRLKETATLGLRGLDLRGVFVVFSRQHGHFFGFHVLHFRENS